MFKQDAVIVFGEELPVLRFWLQHIALTRLCDLKRIKHHQTWMAALIFTLVNVPSGVVRSLIGIVDFLIISVFFSDWQDVIEPAESVTEKEDFYFNHKMHSTHTVNKY